MTAVGLSSSAMAFFFNFATGRLFLDFYSRGVEVYLQQSTTLTALGFGTSGTVPPSRNWYDTASSYRVEAATSPKSLMLASFEARSDIQGEMVHRVSVGRAHTLVQTYNAGGGRSSYRLWAMGSNLYGQLGSPINEGVDAANPIPALVNGTEAFKSAVRIYAGGDHNAVVDSAGELWLFGSDGYGQLGRGNQGNWSSSPVRYTGPRPWGSNALANVSLGFDHTIVVAGGGAWAFGSNQYGQLGTSAVELSSTPVALVVAGQAWGRACAGRYHSVLLTSAGRVYACGYNAYGQAGRIPVQSVGQETAYETDLANVPLVGGLGAVTVAGLVCGSDHSFVLLSNSSLLGFGLNSFGQLMVETNAGLANPNPQFVAVDRNSEQLSAPAASPRLSTVGDDAPSDTTRLPHTFQRMFAPVICRDDASIAANATRAPRQFCSRLCLVFCLGCGA